MPEEGGGPGTIPPGGLAFRGPRFGIIGPAFGADTGSISGSATLTASASLVATPELTVFGSALFNSSASLVSSAEVTVFGSALFSSSASLVASTELTVFGGFTGEATAYLLATGSTGGDLFGSAILTASAYMVSDYQLLCPCPTYTVEQTLTDLSTRGQQPISGNYKRKGCG